MRRDAMRCALAADADLADGDTTFPLCADALRRATVVAATVENVKEEKITTLVKAAGVTCEPYYPGLFAKLLAKTNVDELISAIGSAPAPGGGGGGGGGGEVAKEEAKKEESDEEEEAGMDFDLFD
jgi:large subunit ribosomal protein LP1